MVVIEKGILHCTLGKIAIVFLNCERYEEKHSFRPQSQNATNCFWHNKTTSKKSSFQKAVHNLDIFATSINNLRKIS